MSADVPIRRLAAILTADIVGYTHLVESNEAGTLAAWRALQAPLTKDIIVPQRGRVFRSTRDDFLAIVDCAVDAANCAVRIQQLVAGDQAHVEIRVDSGSTLLRLRFDYSFVSSLSFSRQRHSSKVPAYDANAGRKPDRSRDLDHIRNDTSQG